MRLSTKNIRFQLLLVGLFLYMITSPFLKESMYTLTIVNVLLTYVLLSAVFTLQKNLLLKTISILLLIGCLIPVWLNTLGVISISLIFTYGLVSLYLGIIIASMLIRFFSAKKVSATILYAALCLYLLIGIFWGMIYALIEIAKPGSFQGALLDTLHTPELSLHGLIYFSFVTLTTLGYGDIAPQNLQAGVFCQTEAIIGQFFTSVLIAHLVGLHIAQRKKEAN